ncbi:MAG: N-acetyl-gamma-glutamyl-phosphate reductase [Acidimicrobiales bacterium]
MKATYRAGVLGGSGFAGAELLRLLAGHPHLDVTMATGETQAGVPVAVAYPSLAAAYPDLVFEAHPPPGDAAGLVERLDVVFLALPHGASQALVPELVGKVALVVDLAADFRLRDPGLYPIWYGQAHSHPELLAEAVHGIPELVGERLAGAGLVAAAGCYVTAAALALAPLVRAGLVEPTGIVVDAASGVSGAGRSPKPATHFNTVDEDFTAYGLLDHRHTPEIEQALRPAEQLAATRAPQVLFTPHLAPMNRGILATCYARPTPSGTGGAALAALTSFYAGAPFVVVSERSPSTKVTLGSNTAHLTALHDPRTGWVVALCALDNLTKGAAGQAIQCANVALGLPETAGLPVAGVYP